MTTLSEDEVEFGRDWSMATGEKVAWEQAAALVLNDAAAFYRAGDDARANLLRGVGRQLEERAKEASARLSEFIAEDARRRERNHA